MATAAEEQKAVLLRGDDNVAVAARPIPKGFVLTLGDQGRRGPRADRLAAGHKVALADVEVGQPVRKYGQIIGFASKAIPAGSWVHVHSTSEPTCSERRDYAYATEPPGASRASAAHVSEGYLRPDGRVGTPKLRRGHFHGQLLGQHLAVHLLDRFAGRRGAKTFPTSDGTSSRSRTRAAARCRSAAPITRPWSACWPGSPITRTSRRT